MICKDNNCFKIRFPCYTKVIKDNHTEVSIRLNVTLSDTHTIDNSITDSIIKRFHSELKTQTFSLSNNINYLGEIKWT